jgi:hypothetical protein
LDGERLGPFSRDALRVLLDTHPDGWTAPVWRLGMLDWRAASSVPALTAEAPAPQPLLVGTSAPLDEPPRAAALRNTAGELRVVSYAELKVPARELRVEAAAPAARTLSPATSGEWAAVGTSELSAIGTSELRALSLGDSPRPPMTMHELPAVHSGRSLAEQALPSVIVSGETSTELPSFSWRAERDPRSLAAVAGSDAPARPAAQQAATPTPRSLPAHNHAPLSQRPSRAPLFVMAGLLLLSATAFGVALTLRWLRAYESNVSHARAYARAPLPPRRELTPRDPVARQVPALPAAEAAPTFDATPARLEQDSSPANPSRSPAARAAKPVRERAAAVGSIAARSGDSLRVSAASAKVHVGNHAEAKVVCSLAHGTVRSVLTELPGAHGRWFAVHCDDKSVGWVNERDVARVER